MRKMLFGLFLALGGAVAFGAGASACGGLFCQNNPVNQVGERIVFTVNDNGTITSLIEIQYFGTADDFSWILPIPSAISADDLAVPDNGQDVFAELHALTDVRIIAPDRPACMPDRDLVLAQAESLAADVEVIASGEVGPFGFDVITSEDPAALTTWLRDNDYRVEPSMEPLIDVYVDEQFAFLAMRLLDGETADAIQPIEITYEGSQPMIPIRLTAVAAADNMPVFTWIFADDQVVPDNYVHMAIPTEQITFFNFGGNDYQSLLRNKADEHGGQAFVTEFAAPSSTLAFDHRYLRDRAAVYPYLTRLTTDISPHEMTVDPVFRVEPGRDDVSNVRDASNLTGLWECERDAPVSALSGASTDAISAEALLVDIGASAPRQLNTVDSSDDDGGSGKWRLPAVAALFGFALLAVGQVWPPASDRS